MTKEQLLDALQAHKADDALVHQNLLEAVQGFDGDTKKLELELDKHIKKTDDGHDNLIAIANDL